MILRRYNQSHSKTVREDYSKLFDKTIKTEFLKVTNGKGIFLTSTPSNGELSASAIAENPNDPLHGDGKSVFYIQIFSLSIFLYTTFTVHIN